MAAGDGVETGSTWGQGMGGGEGVVVAGERRGEEGRAMRGGGGAGESSGLGYAAAAGAATAAHMESRELGCWSNRRGSNRGYVFYLNRLIGT